MLQNIILLQDLLKTWRVLMENLRAELSWGTAQSPKGDLIKEDNRENTCSLQRSGDGIDRMCVGQASCLQLVISVLKRLEQEDCSEIEASLSSIVSLGQYEQPWGLSPQTNKNIGFGVCRTAGIQRQRSWVLLSPFLCLCSLPVSSLLPGGVA